MNKLAKSCTYCAALTALATSAHAQVSQTNIVSDGFTSSVSSTPKLVNPIGLAFSLHSPLWIASAGSNVSAQYWDGGKSDPLNVVVPINQPSGVVYNPGTGFAVTSGGVTEPASYIFVTQTGRIAGWAPGVDRTTAVVAVNNVVPLSCYKGVEISNFNGKQYLYAANFHEGKIDMFDSNFMLEGSFTDPNMPSNYAPTNVKEVGGYLVVTYGQVGPARLNATSGQGLGFVDLFTNDGVFVRQLAAGGRLNSPYGIATAEPNWGNYEGQLLIGNHGDGHIIAIDMLSGTTEPIKDTSGNTLAIDGLWSIAMRPILSPKGTGNLINALFFTSGPNNGANGLVGRLTFQSQ